MSQIRGKQIKDQSVVLDKLSGAGSVTFLTGAGMTFNSGSNLYYTDAPTQGTEVANKDYVDSVASGLEVKESAQAISVSNIANSGYASGVISGVSTNLQIDGITILDGARVVLNGQTAPAHNGIYVYDQGAGTLTRSTDMDEPAEVNGGEFVFIKEGNTYADTGWVVSTPDGSIVIGTGDIQFTQFSSVGVINAGLGLLQTGNTFDIITGVGLTASANELKLDNTTVTTGSYGSADTVSTFTVDQQGRLTTAGSTTIDITASQVSDFATAVNDEVFDTGNFVDSDSVDFDVTAGATVSAYVKTDTTRGADINASGVFVKIDNSTITFDVSGNLQAVIPAATVTGASNGLDLSGTDVILGGTLSQDTIIDGGQNNFGLTLQNMSEFIVDSVDNLSLGSSQDGDITVAGQLNLDANILDFNATDTVSVTSVNNTTLSTTGANGDFNVSALGSGSNINVTSNTADVNIYAKTNLTATSSNLTIAAVNGVYVDTDASPEGLKYDDNYHSTYVNRSLVDKEYVDLGTASIWTAIQNSTYFAGGGLVQNGSVIDVKAENGLTVNTSADRVELGGSLDQETIINGQISNRFAIVNTNGMTFSSVRDGIAIRTESGTTDADIWVNTLGDDSDIIIRAEGNNTIVDIDATREASIDATLVSLATAGTNALRMGNSSAVFDLDFNSSTVTSANLEGLVYTADYSSTFVDESLITKRYVDNGTSSIWTAINAITGSDIEEITAGNGLTGGGTQGTIDVAVGDGAGIQVNADSIEVEITAQGGLTFSAAGAAGTLQIAYDSNTLNIVDGELTVVGGSARPVYQAQNSLAAVGAPSAGADTGLSLTSTPNDYSRIEVYVNGQKQLLGGQGSFNETNSDCWFGNPGSATLLTNLTSGAKLYWNSVTAGFKLDTSDLVEIAYEA